MDDMDAMEVSDDDNIPERLPKFNCYSYYVKDRSLSRRSNRLLPQQKEALETLCQWFDPDSENKDKIALVSMPTGSGKTGMISCLPYFLGSIGLTKNESNTAVGHPNYPFKQPVLVIAPDLAISKQLEEQLSVSQSGSIDQPFLIRRKIVPQDRHKEVLPTAIRIERTDQLTDQYALGMFDMIIANAQKFLQNNFEETLPNDMFQLVVVDEAHHHPALTWQRIVNKFQNKALVVFFTATPYRGDRKPVLKDITPAYHLSLKEAVKTGIIRQTNFQEFKLVDPLPRDVYIRDLESKTDEEKKSLRRMVTILRKVKELIDLKNGTSANAQQLPGGIQHMGMAIAKNIYCAHQLLDLWRAMYPKYAAETYHSKNQKDEKERIMDKLKNNKLRLVIVVAMLLEGFDHPPISIAAITCKIASPVKFAQFVGRAQRIYRGPEGTEMNGQADIITHVHYAQRQLYKNFINETLIPDDPENNLKDDPVDDREDDPEEDPIGHLKNYSEDDPEDDLKGDPIGDLKNYSKDDPMDDLKNDSEDDLKDDSEDDPVGDLRDDSEDDSEDDLKDDSEDVFKYLFKHVFKDDPEDDPDDNCEDDSEDDLKDDSEDDFEGDSENDLKDDSEDVFKYLFKHVFKDDTEDDPDDNCEDDSEDDSENDSEDDPEDDSEDNSENDSEDDPEDDSEDEPEDNSA